ncbi:UPF0687 protein C20orf27 homolog isoform X1 [Otolemur garnettii]|uniref:UPF0687 protein C20orf27 homolog isoform X1 n=1 Tax=Otolemur garnettii TaxID=30611 RepID=UPI0006444DA4|nr:UPF0687 protein C20orf27 homolog isoform X1 [Otolemur garnettii]
MAAANKGNKPRVRSIRFAASHDAEGSQSHVHFDEKLHDSVVMVTQESDSSFLVKVGFLKILHRYEITFTLPPVHRLSKDVHEAPVPSLHLKLLGVVPTSEAWQLGRSHAPGLTHSWTEVHELTPLACICLPYDNYLCGEAASLQTGFWPCSTPTLPWQRLGCQFPRAPSLSFMYLPHDLALQRIV